MNTRLTRTLIVAGFAAAVAVTATVAAMASTPRDEMTAHMGDQLPGHMQQLTDDQWTEMGRLMSDNHHAGMHDWMHGEGLDVDGMHHDPVHDATGMRGMDSGMAGSGR